MIRSLDKSAYDYCFKVCKLVLSNYDNPRIDDYPAMVAACSLHNELCIAISHESMDYCELMQNRFMQTHYVTAWNKSLRTKVKYKIGNCAEQQVANKVLNLCSKHTICSDTDIDHIEFSRAIRPRTKCTHKYCDNCLLIFPQIHN